MFEKFLKITPSNQEIIDRGLPEDLEKIFDQFRRNYGQLQKTSVIVLIPAYNEEGSIAEVILKVPPHIENLPTEVIVVNDGSTDGTSSVAKNAGAKVLEIPKNAGQGAALKAGYLLALSIGTKFIAVVDGDGQWDPSDLEDMMRPLLNGIADFSQGSRRLGETNVGDRFRDYGVEFFTRLVSFLINVHVGDTSSGYRAYRSEILAKVRLRQKQYQSSEILISAICNGARLYEHPVKMSPRSSGTSKKAPNWRYGLYYLNAVIQTTLRDKYLLRIFSGSSGN